MTGDLIKFGLAGRGAQRAGDMKTRGECHPQDKEPPELGKALEQGLSHSPQQEPTLPTS